ncbi:hypothetical protein AMS58_03005 [Pseudoalteromonas porphyrae]|uniref:DUF4124 domain-containing protein n=1 Tax=Pseudoalteromonas porphyrae TaxID=187330 RepID=A0A0N0M0M7_9GAMM|nr:MULTISPECIES: hypothetical protein [Pseudoalteromonas]KPH64231.1 hypothetical protein ADS77_05965 [Pseudoalteromonas porphyrae]KPH96064.1 hypothetical protein AMS58_03005 [Pseudoalteromonas porphyrae]NMR23993.1 DUF4124 domain-containing protein [Pseudoalteromonas sp. NEC-BIFX-2020_015]NNG44402.1 DUF4124 domain-containing protein [Pseudoalteromonas sp. NEC-BIFX-2020_002]
MKSPAIFFIFFIVLFTSSLIANDTHYYKCITDKVTTFSQFPCSGQATQHKVTTANVADSSKIDHTKSLNALEREQIVRNLHSEIRSVKHTLAILSRKRDTAEYNQQERLTRLMSDDDKKHTAKDIKKQIKRIDKTYAKKKKSTEKKLAALEKKLKRYE